VAEHRATQPIHRSVLVARLVLIEIFLYSAWLIWTIVAVPKQWISATGGVLLFGLGIALRLYWLPKSTRGNERPSRAAWLPAICVIVALVGYGLILSAVQADYYSKQYDAYRPVWDRWFKAEVQRGDEETTRELMSIARAFGRKERSGSQSSAQATPHNGAHAPQASSGSTSRTPVAASRPPREPSRTELGPWFDHLAGFFTIATQVLAAAVVVLAFARWRSGVSEAVYRTAMPVAVLGVGFGLAGTLPSLSRTLHAILLAPVLAGLAGAIGALTVASTEIPRESGITE